MLVPAPENNPPNPAQAEVISTRPQSEVLSNVTAATQQREESLSEAFATNKNTTIFDEALLQMIEESGGSIEVLILRIEHGK